jgi:hypothetical protein
MADVPPRRLRVRVSSQQPTTTYTLECGTCGAYVIGPSSLINQLLPGHEQHATFEEHV